MHNGLDRFLDVAEALRRELNNPRTVRLLDRAARARSECFRRMKLFVGERFCLSREHACRQIERQANKAAEDSALAIAWVDCQINDLGVIGELYGGREKAIEMLTEAVEDTSPAQFKERLSRPLFEIGYAAANINMPWLRDALNGLTPLEFHSLLLGGPFPRQSITDEELQARLARLDEEEAKADRASAGVVQVQRHLDHVIQDHLVALKDTPLQLSLRIWLRWATPNPINVPIVPDPRFEDLGGPVTLEMLLTAAWMEVFLRIGLGIDFEPAAEMDEGMEILAAWLRNPGKHGGFAGDYPDAFRLIGDTIRHAKFGPTRRRILDQIKNSADPELILRNTGKLIAESALSWPDAHLPTLGKTVAAAIEPYRWDLPAHLVRIERAFEAEAFEALEQATRPEPRVEPSPPPMENLPPPSEESQQLTHEQELDAMVRMDAVLPEPKPRVVRRIDILYVERIGSHPSAPIGFQTDEDSIERTLGEICSTCGVSVTVPLSSLAKAIRDYIWVLPPEHRQLMCKEPVGGVFWNKLRRAKMRIYIRTTAEGVWLHLQQRKDWVHPQQLN